MLVTAFQNFFGSFVGGGTPPVPAEDIFECPAEKRLMILSLDVCNKLDTGVQVDIIIYDSSANGGAGAEYYLSKNTPIPVGATLQVISKQKHVLEEGDIIRIYCNLPDSLDVVGCYMDVYTV